MALLGNSSYGIGDPAMNGRGRYNGKTGGKSIHVIKGKPGASDDVQAELRRLSLRDINYWQTRNTRFQRDQELYKLTVQDVAARNNADTIILPDPKILVRKLTRLLARHPNIIEVPPFPGIDPVVAQKIENYLYLWDQDINQQWIMGLKHPYRFVQAFHCTLRGWVCERTLIKDDMDAYDPAFPASLFTHDVIDPVNVYPFSAGGEVRRVTHHYKVSYGELLDDPIFGDSIKDLYPDYQPDHTATVDITGVYWKDGDNVWQHAVFGTGSAAPDDGLWIKKPTELGYNPWTIVLANGSAYERTPWDDISYIEEQGTGILDDAADMFKYLSRMATKLNELLSLEANPPVTVTLRSGQMRTFRFTPGARNFLLEREKLEPHRIGPNINDYQLLWDILNQRISRATLPPAFYAEYSEETGGFQASVIMAAGKDILFPYTSALNFADSLKYRKVLELYRDFGPSTPLRTKIPASEGLGQAVSAAIDSIEIDRQGTYVEITREDMAPQELAARINLGLSMVRDKAISLETFRKDWAKIRNPSAENLRVIAEHVFLSEDTMKALIPKALEGLSWGDLGNIWSEVQNSLPTGPTDGAQPGGPGVPGAMPPSMPGPPMPPGPPGMPPAGPVALPPPGMLPPDGLMSPQMGPPVGNLPPEILSLIMSLGQEGSPEPMMGPMMGPGLGPTNPGAQGLDTQTLPPIFGGNLLANSQLSQDEQEFNALMAQISGGGVGGAGAGGTPPVPGTTTRVRRNRPPGRR